jgi:hypothetical protein
MLEVLVRPGLGVCAGEVLTRVLARRRGASGAQFAGQARNRTVGASAAPSVMT